MIVIIDYGMGNLRSVAKALEASGAKNVKVTSSPALISKAEKLVLPGVGAMQEAMRELRKLRLIEVIEKNIFKKPFLGICLGLQLLFSESEEGGDTKGLGIFKGQVKRFSHKLKVPHMGWNQIKRKTRPACRRGRDERRGLPAGEAGTKDEACLPARQGRKTKESLFLKNIPNNSFFYFCHSYYVVPQDTNLIATTTDYGIEFVSSICKDSLFACQFHPEKSQRLGLRLLKNFVEL